MSNKSRRIAVVVTARPSYSRIRSVLDAARLRDDINLFVIAGASILSSRYGVAVEQLIHDGHTPDWTILCQLDSHQMAGSVKTTALLMQELSGVFDNIHPDSVVTIADRYETIATAVAAAYMNIPLFHLQGGEITGNIDEKVRHAITKLSDYHFVSNELARERVLRMGEEVETVFNTGCPSIDLATQIGASSNSHHAHFSDFLGAGTSIDPTRPYLVVMQHPVTTHIDSAFREMKMLLEAMIALDHQVVWFWPNADSGSEMAVESIRTFRKHNQLPGFAFLKNMPPLDFLNLLKHSKCLVGNSSVGIRECAYLGVPVVNIGDRQKGRQRGPNVIDVAEDKSEIISATISQIAHGPFASSQIYGDGAAGQQIAELLATLPLRFDKQLTY